MAQSRQALADCDPVTAPTFFTTRLAPRAKRQLPCLNGGSGHSIRRRNLGIVALQGFRAGTKWTLEYLGADAAHESAWVANANTDVARHQEIEMAQHQPASHGSIPSAPAKRGRAKIINPSEAVYYGHYDLSEFIAKYGLTPLVAREIFGRVGPARSDLDKFMNERRQHLAE